MSFAFACYFVCDLFSKKIVFAVQCSVFLSGPDSFDNTIFLKADESFYSVLREVVYTIYLL